MIEALYGISAAAGVAMYVTHRVMGIKERRYLDARQDRMARLAHKVSQMLPQASLEEFHEYRAQLERMRTILNHCALATGITGRPLPQAPDIVPPLPTKKV